MFTRLHKPKQKSLQELLGHEQWSKLESPIQRRFSGSAHSTEPIIYAGTMSEVRNSKAGRLFAFLTKIIGNPLTPYSGTKIPTIVKLYKIPENPGVYWERTYYFPRKKPYVVTSVKKINHRGRLSETVKGGFSMELDVFQQGGNLHFKSTRYFWHIFSIHLPLPHWLSPGQTHVIHQHISEDKFKFSITMHHKILGQTFFQEGVFDDMVKHKDCDKLNITHHMQTQLSTEDTVQP